MLLTVTSVEIDPDDVESFFGTLRSLTLDSILKIILLIVVLLVLVKLLSGLFTRFLSKSRIDPSLHAFLRTGVKILMYAVAVLIVASSLDVDVTSLIAILSVAGLALSLALQDSLSNMASCMVILASRPLHVGDYVAIGDCEGFVQEIGMTYTKLSAYDKRIIYIPNSSVTSANVVNYTVEGRRRVEITVNASYDCSLDAVKAALHEAVETVGNFYEEPPVFVGVTAYEESAIAYTIRAWCSADSYWDNYFALLEEIKRSFDLNNIQMTYPHINVHMVRNSQDNMN